MMVITTKTTGYARPLDMSFLPIHTIDFGLVVFDPLKPAISRKNFTHVDSLGKEISHSLFQPPLV